MWVRIAFDKNCPDTGTVEGRKQEKNTNLLHNNIHNLVQSNWVQLEIIKGVNNRHMQRKSSTIQEKKEY